MKSLLALAPIVVLIVLLSFRPESRNQYVDGYINSMIDLESGLEDLLEMIPGQGPVDEQQAAEILSAIHESRMDLKAADFWMRYLQPITYRKVNGPLPVEWETEVFEKFEAPYRREGGGLMLAESHLAEGGEADELRRLIQSALEGAAVYTTDTILPATYQRHHFLYCNRLFLLNLSAIYTTGFECPDPERILPELKHMLAGVLDIYKTYNATWPEYALTAEYLEQYGSMRRFVNNQPTDYDAFDHFSFIRDFVDPLYAMNQEMIRNYRPVSRSFNDYSLDNASNHIFDKNLYRGQMTSGLFASVSDPEVIQAIKETGRMLFFDPLLSGNNKRSCASCHIPEKAFSDGMTYNMNFNGIEPLTRNTPSLINAVHQHLLHQDGNHISAQSQAIGVITNPDEMDGQMEDIVDKVMSCKEYKKAFQSFLSHTGGSKEVTISHIVSAITMFYGDFSQAMSPFDEAMTGMTYAPQEVIEGFNLFMGKSQCATCHFVPQFNGVKPPYIGSEFEVLGVPADKAYSAVSPDSGRYVVHHADEMIRAFRTNTVRNIEHTAPYMHNGVFTTLEEVVDFYDGGGGAGRGLDVPNQTLPADSLHLTAEEQASLISFMKALSEKVELPEVPSALPKSSNAALNNRKVGGEY